MVTKAIKACAAMGAASVILCSCGEASSQERYQDNVAGVVELRGSVDESNFDYASAWFVSPTLLVTCFHAIGNSEGEASIFDDLGVRFFDENEYTSVTMVDFDSAEDIALLSYKGSHSRKSFGLAAECRTGEFCFNIGNFNNYGLSYKEGLVSLSSVNMEYNGMKQSFIQCTLGIRPGDSGSPILNESNEVLGMVAYRSRNNAGTVEQNFCYGIPSSRIGSAVN